jgi:hypothetical protein
MASRKPILRPSTPPALLPMAVSRKLIKNWDPVSPATLKRETVAHVMLLAVGWSSGVGYLGMMLMLGAELLLLTLLSIVVYPERGVWRHFVSLAWFVFLLAFLGLFVVLTYRVAMESVPGFEAGENPFSVVRLDPNLVYWTLGYTALHLLAMLVYARTRKNPRAAWSESVLMQGSATMMTVFIMIFGALIVGGPLLTALQWVWTMSVSSAEAVLILLLVLAHFGMSLVISRLPQSARDEIAENPYVE